MKYQDNGYRFTISDENEIKFQKNKIDKDCIAELKIHCIDINFI